MCNLKYKSNEQGFLENTEKGIFLFSICPHRFLASGGGIIEPPAEIVRKRMYKKKSRFRVIQPAKDLGDCPQPLLDLPQRFFLATLVT